MTITELLGPIKTIEITGTDKDKEISTLTADSRQAGEGSMFVAVRGVTVDGHSFIPTLKGKGVAAIVCEELPAEADRETGVTYIRVENTSIALGELASRWYGEPSKKLRLVGVTGTNGKTTTATLIYEMARLMGYKAGLLSTVVNYIDTEAVHATQTTPDALTINALLAKMVERGCEYAAMEVSSHAADQHRIAGLTFAGGLFTNLTRDHLDYHKTVQAYLNAKKSFFDGLPAEAFALVNDDDRNGCVMLQNTEGRRRTYSIQSPADYRVRLVEDRIDGMLLDFDGDQVETMFVGRFNASNLAAVYGAALELGFERDNVLLSMSRLRPVAGRFQPFRSTDGVTAIVDYAHTPDALVNVLDTIREIVGPDGRITTVVGAGGDRDHGKRPQMAQESACRSDRLVLTADNPRSEDPAAIIADMKAGLSESELRRTLVIADRREAIRTAILTASEGEVVLVAGKGHETYQETNGVRHHFDDREEVRDALAQL